MLAFVLPLGCLDALDRSPGGPYVDDGLGTGGAGTGGDGSDGSGGAGDIGSGGSPGSGGDDGNPGTGGDLGGTGGMRGTGGRGGPGTGGHLGGSGGDVGSGGGVGSGGRAAGTGGMTGSGGALGSGGRSGSGGSTAAVCTSNMRYSGGTGPTMEPGVSCNTCHNHAFTIYGTIYPTAHEPNLCYGSGASGVRVVITGADGSKLTLTPSASGNFYSSTAVKSPYTAAVTSGGNMRAMTASETSGDCNSCHTQNGANGAPGRIMLP